MSNWGMVAQRSTAATAINDDVPMAVDTSIPKMIPTELRQLPDFKSLPMINPRYAPTGQDITRFRPAAYRGDCIPCLLRHGAVLAPTGFEQEHRIIQGRSHVPEGWDTTRYHWYDMWENDVPQTGRFVRLDTEWHRALDRVRDWRILTREQCFNPFTRSPDIKKKVSWGHMIKKI